MLGRDRVHSPNDGWRGSEREKEEASAGAVLQLVIDDARGSKGSDCERETASPAASLPALPVCLLLRDVMMFYCRNAEQRERVCVCV